MTCAEGARVKCGACDDWYCAVHQGHIGERCGCWPCDDCGELFPPDKLSEDYGLCCGCKQAGAKGSPVSDEGVALSTEDSPADEAPVWAR
jgi:hypothetical protein